MTTIILEATMDWSVERINEYNALAPPENNTIRLRKKSNRYTAFARVAFLRYKKMSIDEKNIDPANIFLDSLSSFHEHSQDCVKILVNIGQYK